MDLSLSGGLPAGRVVGAADGVSGVGALGPTPGDPGEGCVTGASRLNGFRASEAGVARALARASRLTLG